MVTQRISKQSKNSAFDLDLFNNACYLNKLSFSPTRASNLSGVYKRRLNHTKLRQSPFIFPLRIHYPELPVNSGGLRPSPDRQASRLEIVPRYIVQFFVATGKFFISSDVACPLPLQLTDFIKLHRDEGLERAPWAGVKGRAATAPPNERRPIEEIA
ncbi:hypothetical protein EVAR_67977_1 [Eumeta japonica]|uniref:Uncharacterized protein n=1 Tax=Eumeta variegata TaxID=151549 RepID=A0A4C1S861_EUMVA|nr:hypothetical protein EVAR_67977_1 [Eumeta japonica]